MSTQYKRIQLSEDFESMAELLCQDYSKFMKKRERVLTPVSVIIPNKDTANWLKPYLAKRIGILANIQFMLPYEWIWKQYRLLYPELPVVLPSDKGPLALAVFDWFASFTQEEHDEDSLSYLNVLFSLDEPLKTRWMFALAGEAASSLDAYQNYRPEMLLSWAQGVTPEDPLIAWQAVLWRYLLQKWSLQSKIPLDRATLFGNQISAYKKKTVSDNSTGSEDHLFVFHAGLLPSPFLHLIDECPDPNRITIYALIREQKTLLSERFSFESRAILDSLRQLKQFRFTSAPDNERISVPVLTHSPKREYQSPKSALSVLKAAVESVRTVDLSVKAPFLLDGSIEIHSCHNALREIEVLHQQIYFWLESIPDLKPSDIMVISPDIKFFSPFISAVFDQQHEGLPEIPYRITEKQNNFTSETDVFLQFLRLLKTRFEPHHVLELLRYEIVMDRFDVSERDLNRIRHWISENRVLWGYDVAHKEDVLQPPTETGTWSRLFTRAWNSLLWGDEFTNPHSGDVISLQDPDDARLISVLQDLLSRLNQARKESQNSAKSLSEWIAELESWGEFLFQKKQTTDSQKLPPSVQLFLNTFISDIEQSDSGETSLPFDLILKHLEQITESKSGSSAVFNQGVLFSNMVPVRGIPARVICLIGVGESRFPRVSTSPEFDVMRLLPLPADRDRKREDRQLFYEAVMAAKDTFYISYVGQNQKDNSEMEPSTVLIEFLDMLCQIFPDADIHKLLKREAMNGYSDRYFSESSNGIADTVFKDVVHTERANYSKRFADLAAIKRQASKSVNIWGSVESDRYSSIVSGQAEKPHTLGTDDDITETTPESLISFFKHPIRAWMRHRFKLTTLGLFDEEWEFEMSAIDRYKVKHYILHQRLKGIEPISIYLSLQRAGQLPEGTQGEREFYSLNRTVDDLLKCIHEFVAPDQQLHHKSAGLTDKDRIQPVNVTIDLTLSSCRIKGKLPLLTGFGTVIHISFSSSLGKNLIESWMYHLLRTIQYPQSERIHFFVLKKSAFIRFCFQSLTRKKAEEYLTQLIQEYQQGLQKPLRFFPNTAAEWVEKNQTRSLVLPDELHEWSSFNFSLYRQTGEAHETYNQIFFGQTIALDPEVDYPIFERIMAPIMAELEDEI